MRTKTGTATSNKMDKTVIITVHTYKQHPKYKKRYRTSKKFYAHDENNQVQEGDTVTVAEYRPTSKLKRWSVVEINGKAVKGEEKKEKGSTTPEETTA
ncbi:MAG: 30S ribosomal protein S17 [Candidatus Gracilibacteria bacterium]|nr:30S ribosomal protein S17 [Candidatus Gracilibacteria bacterium]